MRVTGALLNLLLVGSFWAGARRGWVAFHEMAEIWGGLEAAEGLARLARGRAWAMRSCLRVWLDELRRAGCFVVPANDEEVRP